MSSERSHHYEQHSSIDYEGFVIADVSVETGEKIWVGCGIEGRWMTANQVKELAALLAKVAESHEARTK